MSVCRAGMMPDSDEDELLREQQELLDEENAARAEEAEEAEEAARTATVCEDQGPSPKRARTFGNVPLAQQACAASASGTARRG